MLTLLRNVNCFAPEPLGIRDVLIAGDRIAAIEAPGTLDGGDVLVVGRHLFVGISKRTNAAGDVEFEFDTTATAPGSVLEFSASIEGENARATGRVFVPLRGFEIAVAAMGELGAGVGDVVRTRMFLVDAADADAARSLVDLLAPAPERDNRRR